MEQSRITSTERPRRAARSRLHLIPVLWIAILLGAWLVIVDWRALPDLITATMAALP